MVLPGAKSRFQIECCAFPTRDNRRALISNVQPGDAMQNPPGAELSDKR